MAGPRPENDVVIRGRTPADDDAIRRLNDQAFGGTYESKLIEALRTASLAEIELVAAEPATIEPPAIVGHILFSTLSVTSGARQSRALALAPMAVEARRQRRGIGSRLVRAGLERARTSGWQAVIVLGHTAYYPRFGFSSVLTRALKAPFSGDSFMALALEPGALDGNIGHVVYPPAFGIDPG